MNSSDLQATLQQALGDAYTIERELGGGGMSRVFVAQESALGRPVVIKILPPELASEISAERFRREIQVAARLQHPHIVPVLSAGDAAGMLYYTMPYVEGESLRKRIARDGALGISETVRILRDIFDALACAHRQAVVHRDIKPDNILLSQGHALVTDFGVAKAIAAASELGSTTGTGLALGTPAYMAPEQAAADPHTDHRADIYAAGVLAYELLAGGPPFSGMPPQAILAAHATRPPEHITTRRRAVPVELAQFVMSCLEKHPADRPQTASEALATLESVPASGVQIARRSTSVRSTATKRAAVAAVASIVLLGGGVVIARRSGSAANSGSSAAVVMNRQSIAVLPFRNLSGDSDNDFFADGMTEELIGALTKIDGLQVSPRSSAFAFKNAQATPAEVRNRLHVANILEGSIQKSGTRLRVTVQLVDAASERNLWSETYDRQLADVFAVQDEITRRIVAALRMRLSAGAQQRIASGSTDDVEAYASYLQGRFYWNQRSDAGFRKAIRYFQDAVNRDPNYARAYSGLADSYTLVAVNGFGVPSESYPRAKAAASRAVALDSSLAEARASRGMILHLSDWDYSGAEAEFRRAIQLDSTHANARHWYGYYLLAVGRTREALAELRKAQQLDPLSLPINADLGAGLYSARDFAAATRQLELTLDLDSTFARAHGLRGATFLAAGDINKALPALRRGVELRGGRFSEPWGQAALGYALAVSGQADAARAIIHQVKTWDNTAAVARTLPLIYAGLGDMDEAFRWLERSLDERAQIPTWLRFPLYDVMRADPRWDRILERMGLRR